ncbi:hypothetical protein F442_01593 [Phytophthora nicotianae P10297]|uniref:Uncharacterized protein n=2 Tax=Phytophthora nicotianae TaxID=4792 RepID=W3A2Q9_PHYNI|nr:hypothetical protein F444_01651 [Phytophthora nicotianae P1976]ETP53515.1 hypothetical protein F442_01593 [Phytophthora nicotianae P10297]
MKDASPAPSTSSGRFQRAAPSSASSFGHNRPALRERTSPSYRSTATSMSLNGTNGIVVSASMIWMFDPVFDLTPTEPTDFGTLVKNTFGRGDLVLETISMTPLVFSVEEFLRDDEGGRSTKVVNTQGQRTSREDDEAAALVAGENTEDKDVVDVFRCILSCGERGDSGLTRPML